MVKDFKMLEDPSIWVRGRSSKAESNALKEKWTCYLANHLLMVAAPLSFRV
jgi:hypothetical protein